MTASEFAFLALGLVLGIASGLALVVVVGSRPPAREVKVTVGHDAVPRRAATLSSDAFTAHGEPARGGPADRRRLDRSGPEPDPVPTPAAAPDEPAPDATTGGATPASRPSVAFQIRTNVPSPVPLSTASPAKPAPPGVLQPAPSGVGARNGIPIVAERDPSLDALRIQAVLAAEHAERAGMPTATALLEARPLPEVEAEPPVEDETESPADGGTRVDATPAIIRILRGDQRALIRTVGLLAGADVAMRRPWRKALTGLAGAVIRGSISEGELDFPVGNPFWDTFTTDQCRAIAAALAATGHRFDGIDGWADDRVPSYRDLTMAVAAAGIEPRRIRAWPTQEQIAGLYREATAAADEYFTARVPEMELTAVQALVGSRSADLDLLWRHWDLARPVLAGPSNPS